MSCAVFKRLAQGGDLWPGYDPTKVPAVYLRARRGSLKPERSALFLGVVGARKFPGARVLRSPRCRSLTLIQARAPRNLRQAFTGSSAFTRAPLGGSQLVFAYLYGPRTRLTGSPLRRELLKLVQVGRPLFQETVIHELFHSFQFTNMRDPESDQDSWKQLPDDARFAALAVLESLVAARVDRAQGKEQIRKLARWFVSVRNARLSGSPAVRTFEEGQEWLEGTAQLVEDRAFFAFTGKRPVVPSKRAIEGYLADPGLAGWLWANRFYETGSTIERTLQRLEITGWQTRISRGTEPAQVLRDSLGAIPDGTLATVQAEFGWEELLEQVRAIPLKYRKPRF